MHRGNHERETRGGLRRVLSDQELGVLRLGEVLGGLRQLNLVLLEPLGVSVDAHLALVDRSQSVAVGQLLRGFRQVLRDVVLNDALLGQRASLEVVDAVETIGGSLTFSKQQLVDDGGRVTRGGRLELVAGLRFELLDLFLGQLKRIMRDDRDRLVFRILVFLLSRNRAAGQRQASDRERRGGRQQRILTHISHINLPCHEGGGPCAPTRVDSNFLHRY